MATTSGATTHLGTAECWALLESATVGRLAVTDEEGSPDLFPVNFTAHEGSLYIRSASDAKVVALTARPAAAFEVDGHDDDGWWSVVVRGAIDRVRDEVEIEHSGILRLQTASARHKPNVLRLSARAVTGRRFPDRDEPSADPSTGSLPHRAVRPASRRATKPARIPSRPPLDDGHARTA